jgi:predicted  nucleic acid-binding Zn-ribbon protein
MIDITKKDKTEALVNLIQMKQDLDKTKSNVSALDSRVSDLETTVRKNYEDQRKLSNKVKFNVWQVGQLAIGHKKEVEDRLRRDTDTKEKLDQLQSIVNWSITTIVGLLITTIIAAILKYMFNV